MRGYGLEGRYETLTPLAARLRAGAGQHLKNGISFDDPDLTDFGYDGLYVAVNLSCSHGLLFLNETFLMVRPHMHPPPPSAARDAPPAPRPIRSRPAKAALSEFRRRAGLDGARLRIRRAGWPGLIAPLRRPTPRLT